MEKKNPPFCEISRLKVLTVVAAADLDHVRQLQPGLPPSHPLCQTSWSCQHHFLNDEAPRVCPLACLGDQEHPIRNQLMGENNTRQSFYFTWNYDNHKMALGILWIRFLSNSCIFFNLDTLQWLYCSLVRTVWCSETLKPFRLLSFPPFQIEVCILSTTKRVQMPRGLSVLWKSKPTNSDWLLNLARHTLQGSRRYIKWGSIMS